MTQRLLYFIQHVGGCRGWVVAVYIHEVCRAFAGLPPVLYAMRVRIKMTKEELLTLFVSMDRKRWRLRYW
jgi:hypothetical protein